MSLSTALTASLITGAVSGPVTVGGVALMVLAAPGPQLDLSALFTAAGVLVTALAAATVAVLNAMDRWRRASNRDIRLLRRQNEWLHIRLHAVTVAAAQRLDVPPEHEPYPEDPDDD